MKQEALKDFLLRRRQELNISQEELGEVIGHGSGQFISNIERGRCSLPLKHIKSIATKLQAKPEEIGLILIKEYTERIKKAIK